MPTLNEEYLTVAEAANLVRVSPSTIRRWIREGNLPAYRLGPRRVGLKRDDLSAMVAPIGKYPKSIQVETDTERLKRRKLTSEEARRGVEAMDRLEQTVREISARHGGPSPSSLAIIDEMREERDRQLMEVIEGRQS
jgi:excisionase family DNA binding protein